MHFLHSGNTFGQDGAAPRVGGYGGRDNCKKALLATRLVGGAKLRPEKKMSKTVNREIQDEKCGNWGGRCFRAEGWQATTIASQGPKILGLPCLICFFLSALQHLILHSMYRKKRCMNKDYNAFWHSSVHFKFIRAQEGATNESVKR